MPARRLALYVPCDCCYMCLGKGTDSLPLMCLLAIAYWTQSQCTIAYTISACEQRAFCPSLDHQLTSCGQEHANACRGLETLSRRSADLSAPFLQQPRAAAGLQLGSSHAKAFGSQASLPHDPHPLPGHEWWEGVCLQAYCIRSRPPATQAMKLCQAQRPLCTACTHTGHHRWQCSLLVHVLALAAVKLLKLLI